MCANCGTWKHFTKNPDVLLQTFHLTCGNCASTNFEPRSLISEDTFDEERAKKETKKLMKGKKR